MFIGTYACDDCGLLIVCEDILDSGIGEVLVGERAWAHFDQNGPDIHTCSQWVPNKPHKGVGESRLPQAFWAGISNAGSLVTEVNPGNSLVHLRPRAGPEPARAAAGPGGQMAGLAYQNPVSQWEEVAGGVRRS